MANIKSAKKRIKVIDKKTARNTRVKNHVREAIKAFYDAVEAKDFEKAEETFRVAEKRMMQAASKHTIKKTTAARKISRMAKTLNNAKNA